MPDQNLAAVQSWLQSFIVDPSDDALVVDRETSRAVQLIRPSHSLTAVERASVYREQYLLRMEEALAADYPMLKHFLGEDEFWRFVDEYVQLYPSTSYNLTRLSDHVPEFFSRCTTFKRPGFSYDLVRLEHAIATVFEAAPSPTLQQADVAAVPEGAWGSAHVRPVEALQLLSLFYPVNDYVNSVRAEEKPGSTARSPNWLVVWRRDYTMWRLPVPAPCFHLLKDLADGHTLGETLLRATSGKHRADPQQVFNFFSRCVAEGMFSRIEVDAAVSVGATSLQTISHQPT